MKIIKQGKIPDLPKPWWIGQRATCGYCQTIVEFVEGDSVRETSERRPNGKRWLWFSCPYCGTDAIHDEIIYRETTRRKI